MEAIMGKEKSLFWQRPKSKLGWWAVGLGLSYLVFYIADMIIIGMRSSLPGTNRVVMMNFGFVMLLLGLAAGVVALIAILKKRERSWAVWLALLPGISCLLLLIGEFVVPH
jgi:hypothetical protein